MRHIKFVIFKSPVDRQFYFHLKSSNGRLIAQSEGYKRKRAAIQTVQRIIHSIQSVAYQIEYK